MKYFTWVLNFDDNSNEGTGPESSVTQGTLSGGFEFLPFNIVGYGDTHTNINGLEKWQVTEITQEEALSKALSLNPECYLDDYEFISSPKI